MNPRARLWVNGVMVFDKWDVCCQEGQKGLGDGSEKLLPTVKTVKTSWQRFPLNQHQGDPSWFLLLVDDLPLGVLGQHCSHGR